jgi:hypothetical protein
MATKYEKLTNEILGTLDEYSGCFSKSEEYLIKIKKELSHLKPQLVETFNDGRTLKIGIVGEVKAGKSSFLNALLFSGKDFLPKSSTPMTAALTKIGYSEKSYAKIVFYSSGEWQSITELAKKYSEKINNLYHEYKLEMQKKSERVPHQEIFIKSKEEMRLTLEGKMPSDYVACKELIDLYTNSNDSEDLFFLLGSEKKIEIKDLEFDLPNYIGAKGKYTPIVKHVELMMNIDTLKDLEIIDTPGLNDPIISRSETTKEFLSECDVVFLLSSTSQFLTDKDISLMCETLPKEGIKEVIIVGSKLDSGLLDYNKSNSFKQAYIETVHSYTEQAKSNLYRILSNPLADNSFINSMIKKLPPIYVSSMLYGAAINKKNNQNYSEEQKFYIDKLKSSFIDFADNIDILVRYSGILDIQKKKLIPLRKEKDSIIELKNDEIFQAKMTKIISLLKDIQEQCLFNKDTLENNDKAKLEDKKKNIERSLNRSNREVKDIIKSLSLDIKSAMKRLNIEIEAAINNHIDFPVVIEENITRKSERHGFLYLKQRKWNTVEYTYKVNSLKVVENIRNYHIECQNLVENNLEHAINTRQLEKELRETIINSNSVIDHSFDEREILIPLRNLIKSIKIQDINIDIRPYLNRIYDEFTKNIETNDEIHRLRIVQDQVLNDVYNDYKQGVNQSLNNIELKLNRESESFINKLIIDLKENISLIEKQIDNKAINLERYSLLENKIQSYINDMDKLEIQDV